MHGKTRSSDRQLRGSVVAESLTTCNGCGMHRLCREYEGLWLCIDGPSKCYRRRRAVKADKDRKESERE